MQEIDREIIRACRNTIGDAIRRSTARNPEKDALIFGGAGIGIDEVCGGLG